jgi:hypothetical protein
MPQKPLTGEDTVDPDPRAVRDRAGLAAALLLLKARSNMSYRRLERVTAEAPGARFGLPFTTIRDYLQGRSLPAPDRLEQIVWACGVTDPEAMVEWGRALRRVLGAGTLMLVTNPYLGPAAYDVADADRFRGRAQLTATLVERVRALDGTGGLLAVVGVSGAGTTSLLRAGLVAALRRDDPNRPVRYGTPDGDPPGRLAELLATGAGAGRPVVVLDQTESLFAASPQARATFLAMLEQAVSGPTAVVLVLGLRAELVARAAAEPVLAGALGGRELVVPPMTTDELRAAIAEPAADAGRAVADGLVELLLHELRPRGSDPVDAVPDDAGLAGAAHAPGALPLLSMALSAIWAQAQGEELTVADYRAAGGLDGAAARAAEAAFTALSPDQQRVARAMVLRLVRVRPDAEPVRRRATADELAEQPASAEVTRLLVGARVLTASEDGVAITHDALLYSWPRLAGWLDEDRQGHAVRGALIDAARQWREGGRQDAALLHGRALTEALDRATSARGVELLPSELEYLRAGLDHQTDQHAADRARVRTLQAVITVIAVLAALGVLAVVTGFPDWLAATLSAR